MPDALAARWGTLAQRSWNPQGMDILDEIRFHAQVSKESWAMGHRPYPNADRTRRYVDNRHGAGCPRCGHHTSVHPYRNGQFECRVSRGELPSCRECVARIMRLRSGPFPAMADVAAGFQVSMPPLPSMTVPPGRAVIRNKISVVVQDNTMSVSDAVCRGLICVDQSRRRA